MATTVYKFPLEVKDFQQIQMPEGAKVLCVQAQRETPCIWAEVDSEKAMESRAFETFGTGHPIRSDMGTARQYVGSYQLSGGALVFHVYENTGV